MLKADPRATVFVNLAFKYFLPLPILFGIFFCGLMVVGGVVDDLVEFGGSIVCGILAARLVMVFSADWVGRRAALSRIYGPAYGVLLLVVGAGTFSGFNYVLAPDIFTFKDSLLVPLGWICAVGLPMALGAGICFSDACNGEVEDRKRRPSGEPGVDAVD